MNHTAAGVGPDVKPRHPATPRRHLGLEAVSAAAVYAGRGPSCQSWPGGCKSSSRSPMTGAADDCAAFFNRSRRGAGGEPELLRVFASVAWAHLTLAFVHNRQARRQVGSGQLSAGGREGAHLVDAHCHPAFPLRQCGARRQDGRVADRGRRPCWRTLRTALYNGETDDHARHRRDHDAAAVARLLGLPSALEP